MCCICAWVFTCVSCLCALQRGFGAIRNLALNKNNQAKFGKSAIILILEGLKAHNQTSEGLCIQGISALHSMAVGCEAHKEAMHQAGALDVVLTGVRVCVFVRACVCVCVCVCVFAHTYTPHLYAKYWMVRLLPAEKEKRGFTATPK